MGFRRPPSSGPLTLTGVSSAGGCRGNHLPGGEEGVPKAPANPASYVLARGTPLRSTQPNPDDSFAATGHLARNARKFRDLREIPPDRKPDAQVSIRRLCALCGQDNGAHAGSRGTPRTGKILFIPWRFTQNCRIPPDSSWNPSKFFLDTLCGAPDDGFLDLMFPRISARGYA